MVELYHLAVCKAKGQINGLRYIMQMVIQAIEM